MTKLYFAYGSNLNHSQMQKRCKDSKYIKKIFLKDFKLSFCSVRRSHGVANVVKKKDSKVPGGLWKISKSDERALDRYEGFPTLYTKDYFRLNNDKIMFYIIKRKYSFKSPRRLYLDTIRKGYKDCDLDLEYLKKRLSYYVL